MAIPLKVLVVEDNQQLLHVVNEMLRLLGHEVHGFMTAEAALAAFHAQAFDVLLTDINLPGMSGIELATAAAEKQPGIHIVFASGFGYLVSEKLPFSFTLLQKPYNFAQLRHALEVVVPDGH
jgi:CheY-like chemotaxis protein